MRVEFNFEDVLNSISEEINSMQTTIEQAEDKTLKAIGNLISQNTKKQLRRSDVEEKAKQIQPKNYDGTQPYVHMKDDVKVYVKKGRNGNKYVMICGGKKTKFKWRFLNDGTKHVRATHFCENALRDSNAGIQQAIDNLTRRVTND